MKYQIFPEINGQRLAGVISGIAATLHSPEVHNPLAKLAVGAATGGLVWLFTKAANNVAGAINKNELLGKRSLAKTMMVIAFTQTAAAYCTYHFMRPPIAREVNSLSANATPR